MDKRIAHVVLSVMIITRRALLLLPMVATAMPALATVPSPPTHSEMRVRAVATMRFDGDTVDRAVHLDMRSLTVYTNDLLGARSGGTLKRFVYTACYPAMRPLPVYTDDVPRRVERNQTITIPIQFINE